VAGHSHWKNIMRGKAVQDAKKGALFSKLARQITLAARQGGGDPNMNISLQFSIEKARLASMPKDNIERAVKKGTGELAGGEAIESVTYEAVGPGGVLILIECLTDNRNRTASEVRKILEVRNCRLSSAAWAFEKKGLIAIPAAGLDEDKLTEIILDAGAEDMEKVGDSFHVTTVPTDLDAVKKALLAGKVKFESAEFVQVPKNNTPVDAETGRKLVALLQELDDQEDVQNVYSNVELPETLLTEMSK